MCARSPLSLFILKTLFILNMLILYMYNYVIKLKIFMIQSTIIYEITIIKAYNSNIMDIIAFLAFH